MPFIPASSFQWEMQPDNRRSWPDVWGRRLSCQERGCLHFFRNSFHSSLSQALDDINIMCLVISSAFGASGVSGCTSQECGLPVRLWVLVARYLPSPLHYPRPSLVPGSFAHRQFPQAGENCHKSLLWPRAAGQHACLGAS